MDELIETYDVIESQRVSKFCLLIKLIPSFYLCLKILHIILKNEKDDYLYSIFCRWCFLLS